MIDSIKKLLCAVDGSHSANRAAAYAAGLARLTGASLTFLTVNTVSDLDMAEEPLAWDSTVAGAARDQVRQELAEAVEAAQTAGLNQADCVVIHSRDIPGAIADYVGSKGFDHLVVGSQGRSGLSRLLLGSVAAAVVQQAPCPVTVIK